MVNHSVMYSEDDESQEGYINYKQKYRELKKHLRALIYENECFQDELRKAQRNFVSLSRDKSFLLDRLLKYEKNVGLSSDSDLTESSEEEEDVKTAHYAPANLFGSRKKITKRKRSEAELPNGSPNLSSELHQAHTSAKVLKVSSKPTTPRAVSVGGKRTKKPPAARKPTVKKEKPPGDLTNPINVQQILKSYNMEEMHVASEEQVHSGPMHSLDYSSSNQRYDFHSEGQMTREDIERHLEARRFSPELELNTTATVPAELFSQDPEQESDLEGSEICEFVQLEEDGTSADMILE